jgi:hypothetical protein
MAKRCIGIDIGRSHLRAVQMARTPTGFRVEKTFGVQMRRRTDRPGDILRSLVREHGFDRRATVAVSLPPSAVFFAEIETDDAGLQALRRGVTTELRDDLPIPADKAICQVCSSRKLPNGRQAVLLAATAIELLRQELHLLGQGKVQPGVVDTSIAALQAAVACNCPESTRGTNALLCLDEGVLSLLLTEDGHILTVRNLAAPQNDDPTGTAEAVAEMASREIEISWRKLTGTAPAGDLRLFLSCPPTSEGPLASAIEDRMNCRITTVNCFEVVEPSEGKAVEFPALVAEGLALRAFDSPQSDRRDFLAAFNATRVRPRSLQRELVRCAGLAAAIVVIWSAGLFVKLWRLEAQYAQIKEEVVKTFQQALPEERNVVNPLAQLRQKLIAAQEAEGAYGAFGPERLDPLRVLHTLSVERPSDGDLHVDSLLITGDSVRIVGSCDTFSTFMNWQRVLAEEGGFEVTNAQAPKKDAESGKVRFALLLSAEGRTL